MFWEGIILCLIASPAIAYLWWPRTKGFIMCSAWWACPNRAQVIVLYRRHQSKRDQRIYCCRHCLGIVVDSRRYTGTIITEELR